MVLGKRNFKKAPESHIQKAVDYAKKHPNIIFAAAGEGLGFDRISISIHKDFSDFAKFIQEIRIAWSGIMDVESFLIDLSSKDVVQPLSFKTSANLLMEKKRS